MQTQCKSTFAPQTKSQAFLLRWIAAVTPLPMTIDLVGRTHGCLKSVLSHSQNLRFFALFMLKKRFLNHFRTKKREKRAFLKSLERPQNTILSTPHSFLIPSSTLNP
jgi:hypothetical protein